MLIDSLEVIPYSLPFREPYVSARGQLTERQLILVKVHGEGLTGLGETASLSLRGGAGIAEIAGELTEVCGPALRGGGFEPERVWKAVVRCRSRGASRPEALAAVDIALHDLAGKALGRPVWSLLGAASARPVHCNATLPAANPSRLCEVARDWAEAGFDTFKLKVGLAGDVGQVGAVREALGPDAVLRVDANGAWRADEAAVRLRALARHTIELAEEPTSGLEQMAELRSRTRVAIAADESIVGPRDARRAVDLGACEMASVKLAKVGGIGAALDVAAEIPVYMTSALEGPVAIAAAAHCAVALPPRGDAGVAHGLATERLFSSSIGSGLELRGCELIPTDAPGLGVELDVEALEGVRHGS